MNNNTVVVLVIVGFATLTSLVAETIKSSKRVPRFLSFDTKKGSIDIDLDLTIPFITIPLKNEDDGDGFHKPMVNINLQSITVAGALAAFAAFIVPLLTKQSHDQRYRLEDGFGIYEAGRTINDLVLGNNYVTPCVQRAVCSTIAKVSETDKPSGADKIIDGIATLGWFKQATNGTAIQEAMKIGRQSGSHCSQKYRECALPAEVFQIVVNEFGIK